MPRSFLVKKNTERKTPSSRNESCEEKRHGKFERFSFEYGFYYTCSCICNKCNMPRWSLSFVSINKNSSNVSKFFISKQTLYLRAVFKVIKVKINESCWVLRKVLHSVPISNILILQVARLMALPRVLPTINKTINQSKTQEYSSGMA